MKANSKFLNRSQEFWANVKLLSEKIGYTKRKSKNNPEPKIRVPLLQEVLSTYEKLGLSVNKLYFNNKLTELGTLVFEYFEYRATVINEFVRFQLMDKEESIELFHHLRSKYDSKIPLVYNKQKKGEQIPLFFTTIINVLIEANLDNRPCSYSSNKLSAFTQHKFPVRSMSRRLDGSFPNIINPVALWEVKEYYNTTSFGSKVSDSVYVTMLDGYELIDIRNTLNIDLKHYLMIDGKNAWWGMGKSFLCKLIDSMHMGLITEVLFGREVLDRLPLLAHEWIDFYEQHKNIIDNN